MVATRSRRGNNQATGPKDARESNPAGPKRGTKTVTVTEAKRPSGVAKSSAKQTKKNHVNVSEANLSQQTTSKSENHEINTKPDGDTTTEKASDSGKHYWLMKAEPESRIEKGIDVKFSIDDLAAAKEPEPWDGVRNYVARNNMMAMKKGELGFFYHSNCKVPGIAGILEIADEATVDESAFDPKHPYHDEKSSKDKPRWYCVRVTFKEKFDSLIPLKYLQEIVKAGKGKEIEEMQLFKQSRLSVQKVTPKEWEYIIEQCSRSSY